MLPIVTIAGLIKMDLGFILVGMCSSYTTYAPSLAQGQISCFFKQIEVAYPPSESSQT